MDQLPSELIQCILEWLPLSRLIQLQVISKRFYSIAAPVKVLKLKQYLSKSQALFKKQDKSAWLLNDDGLALIVNQTGNSGLVSAWNLVPTGFNIHNSTLRFALER